MQRENTCTLLHSQDLASVWALLFPCKATGAQQAITWWYCCPMVPLPGPVGLR